MLSSGCGDWYCDVFCVNSLLKVKKGNIFLETQTKSRKDDTIPILQVDDLIDLTTKVKPSRKSFWAISI